MRLINGQQNRMKWVTWVSVGLICLVTTASVNAKRQPERTLNDLFYGESLFFAFQDEYFSAITRLDSELVQHYALDEPELDPLNVHRDAAEFSVGDLELSYRMHQQAGRALERLLNPTVEEPVRNYAAYRLGRIYFQKRYFINTLHSLDLIRGRFPQAYEAEKDLLHAQAHMTQRNYESAIKILKRLKNNKAVEGYAPYNLGVAYIRSGQLEKGAELLNKVGLMKGNSREILALRDKANLTVGYQLLQEGFADKARPFFERVRLDGPFSNKALLWAGWADTAREKYENALVPWTLLHERDVTDAPVQEAYLALPYVYSKLQAYGRAALLYGEAINGFNREIDRLDSSMKSILQGKLLQALQQNEREESTTAFLNNLRELPDAPETRYLLELMAGHDFQESVKNYRDLNFLKNNLTQWLESIKAYQDLIRIRRAYYEPILPEINERFELQDLRMKTVLTKRDEFAAKLETVQRLRDPKALATMRELEIEGILNQLEDKLNKMAPSKGVSQVKARLKRLQGILMWQVNTEYDQRLENAFHHMADLDDAIETLKFTHDLVIRTKKEAYQSYEGYDISFRRLSTRLRAMSSRVTAVMAQQGRYLEKVAVKELDRRRQKLADYQVKARFALAESYDRATKRDEETGEIIETDANADLESATTNEAVQESAEATEENAVEPETVTETSEAQPEANNEVVEP